MLIGALNPERDRSGEIVEYAYDIDPRNCHADGQSTNCKVNARVLQVAKFVIEIPTSGSGASVTIEYRLPRRTGSSRE